MARRSIDQRIAELEEQARALKARKAKTDQANETRRKVMLGSLVLRDIEADNENARALKSWLLDALPGYLTRDHDKEIFAELLARLGKVDHA